MNKEIMVYLAGQYYSGIKKNEVLMHTTAQMALKYKRSGRN